MEPLRNHHIHKTAADDFEVASLMSESESSFEYQPRVSQRPRLCTFITLVPWILSAISTTTTLYLMKKSLAKPLDPSQLSYTPAHAAVEYETKIFQQGFRNDTSPYQGWPNDEIDDLWERLYSKGVTLHIDASMHDRLATKSERIAIPGLENEYMVGLDVFHQLHCLNTIRKAFYPKRYNISFFLEDGAVDFMEWLHIDHCIESIRQSLTCNADISTNHYLWLDGVNKIKPRLDSVHTCRNFEKIQDWAFDRYVDFKNDRLHVENGKIVDYSAFEDPKVRPNGPNPSRPEGFHHTRDEFMSS